MARRPSRAATPLALPSRRLLALGVLLVATSAGACGGKAPSPSTAALVVVRTTALPVARVGVPYAARVEATGPHEPLTWRVAQGRLPPGLSLDSGSGDIVGVPRAAARFHAEVEVRDGPDEAGARDATFAAASRAFELLVEPGPLVVLAAAIPPIEYGAPFSFTVEAVGGAPPYRFDLAGGSLPVGLSLEPDGLLRGTARSAGPPSRPLVRATDAAGSSTTREFELRVVVLPLRIATGSLPDAARGFPYDETPLLRPAGAGAPFVWTVEAPRSDEAATDGLPPGLRVDAATGRIAGTASVAGTFRLTLVALDAVSQRSARDLTIRVNAGPVVLGVSPASLGISGGPVAVSGQGFQPGMTVAFGYAAPVSATVTDPTRASVIPPSSPTQSGSVDVRVTNPDGGSHVRPAAFRYPYATVEFVAAGVRGTARDHSRGVAVGDVNGDGLADVAHVGSQGIEILRATGAAQPGAFTTKVVRSDGSFNDVRLADVDADGDLDLVVSRSSTTDSIETYRNDGTGGFPSTASASTTYARPSSFHYPYALATGDVDGDGVVDVAFTSGRGGQGVVFVHRGLGDGSFVEAHTSSDSVHEPAGGCYAPNAIELADLDGDGRDDVVVTDAFPACCAPGQQCPSTPAPNAHPGATDFVAWVSLSPASGGARTWRVVRVGGQNGRLDGDNTGLALYDHDGDGRLDLAVLGGYRSQRGAGVAWLTGDGRGGFTERFTRPTTYNRRFGAGIDADGDGHRDLILVGGDGTLASGYGNGWSVAECWLGGTTEVPRKAWTSGSEFQAGGSIPGSNPGRVAVGDLDGDGRDDFVVSQSFHAKERYANDQDDGPVEGVAIYLNRSR